MLLAVGLWAGVFGYAVLVWGVQVWQGQPQRFAFLLGLSPDAGPGAGGGNGSGNISGFAGPALAAGSSVAAG